MKKLSKYPILLLLYSATALFVLSYCKSEKQQPIYEDLGSVKSRIITTNTDFEKQINELKALVSKDSDEKLLQEKFESIRKTYKKMEWAIEYFLPHSARFINGPALPEIEMDEHTEIEPEGLQVLEEMFYPTRKRIKMR